MNVKGQDIRSFLNNIYLALGQAKLELLKNHELARGYLFSEGGDVGGNDQPGRISVVR